MRPGQAQDLLRRVRVGDTFAVAEDVGEVVPDDAVAPVVGDAARKPDIVGRAKIAQRAMNGQEGGFQFVPRRQRNVLVFVVIE